MKQLLCWHVDLLLLALTDGDLPALIPRDLFAVRPGLGGAVGGGEDLAGEGVGHLHPGAGLGLVVPELLLGAAGHLRDDKLNLLLHQLALLPGHGLTLLCPGPDLNKSPSVGTVTTSTLARSEISKITSYRHVSCSRL